MKLSLSLPNLLTELYGFDLRLEDCTERLFILLNNSIPSRIEVDNNITQKTNYGLLKNDILKKYKIDSDNYFINKQIYQSSKDDVYNDEYEEDENEDIIYSAVFKLEESIFFLFTNEKIIIFYKNTEITKAEKLEKELLKLCDKHKKEDIQNNTINLLSQNSSGLTLKKFTMKMPTDFKLEENYNDDFIPINDLIIERLEEVDGKGIILLHGIPGGGKSSLLKHLCSKTSKKKIFIPPDLAHQVSSPSFIPFLIKHQNAILIIEDAETVIEERSGGNNQAVSNLLNISDGLLSDCLKMQIICTFNADVSKVDKALMRKGRLIAKYDFQPLSVEKSNKLLKKLGKSYVTKEPMILTDIYNLDEKEFKEERPQIGFKS